MALYDRRLRDGERRRRQIIAASDKEALCEAYDIDPPLFITLSHLQASKTLENISPDPLDPIMGLS